MLSHIKILILFIVGAVQLTAQEQYNLSLVSHLSYPERLNDVWGYTAPDGTEYALVGTFSTVSIVSLADPANPVEVASIPGDETIWRDLKIWNQRAYVTADTPSEDGLLIIDLSDLPNSANFINWNPTFDQLEGEENDTLYSCHNLYIDENGFAYLAGCNLNEGGPIILDLNTSDGIPEYTGATEPIYSHDVYARNNLLYSAEINDGKFGIYDVSDKQEPLKLAEQTTPSEFCHNVWLSDDGNILFTTDERSNSFTAAYDISDFNAIKLTDAYRPAATLGTGVVPHNVHVLNDYLVISHYSDGCIIVDATDPENLVEVGQYDTYPNAGSGLNGNWGAYPYLPSGLILASDIQNGLFVLDPNYVRASYLEGKVRNAVTNAPLPNVSVEIEGTRPNIATTDLGGNYKTGLATSGTFTVQFSAVGFYDKTVETTLAEAELTTLDVLLDPLPEYTFAGIVFDKFNGERIQGVKVLVENEDVSYEAETDEEGLFIINNIFEGSYTYYLGKWGYENITVEGQLINEPTEIIHELEEKYEDNFNLDLGWETESTADRGDWDRGLPIGSVYEGQIVQAYEDTDDEGDRCYVTRNRLQDGRSGDIDNGEVILVSPKMDLTKYINPHLNYNAWWVNLPIEPDFRQRDSMLVFVDNGIDQVLLEVITTSNPKWRESPDIDLKEKIEITDEMHVVFIAFDRFLTDDIADAGVDNFRITDEIEGVFTLDDDNTAFGVLPNPFYNQMSLIFNNKSPINETKAILYDMQGREMQQFNLEGNRGRVNINVDLAAGMYFLVIETDGIRSESIKVVKAR